LKRGCNQSTNGHEYFYAQDINTAAQQSATQASKMNTPTNPATSVLCLCDPVAPQFGLNAYSNNNYWPESILGSNQTMDWDSIAQTYSSSSHKHDSLACPNNGKGCGWDNAVGLAGDVTELPLSKSPGAKIYKMMTGKNTLPVASSTLDIVWGDWNMLASLIENTGPGLTPQRMAAAAPNMGARGGGATGYALRTLPRGQFCWTQDTAVVYWNANAKSDFNGEPGHYIQIEGSRMRLGQYATMKEPPAPTADKRR